MARIAIGKAQRPWASGGKADVYVYGDFEKDYAQISLRSRAKIEATLRDQYCCFGFVKSREKWNRNEDRHVVEGKSVLVQAVKHSQVRVYGVEGSVNGRRAFFISAIEPAKKKDKADRALLKRAAEGAILLASQVPNSKV